MDAATGAQRGSEPEASGTASLRLSDLAHLVLTVSDMEASAVFWEGVFGFRRLGRVDEPRGRQQQPRILLRHPDCRFVLVVQQPYVLSSRGFDPTHIGLDHLSLKVPDHATLLGWASRLDQAGISRSPICEIDAATFLTFVDPDGIQCELWCAKLDHGAHAGEPAEPRSEAAAAGLEPTTSSPQAVDLLRLEQRRIDAINHQDV